MRKPVCPQILIIRLLFATSITLDGFYMLSTYLFTRFGFIITIWGGEDVFCRQGSCSGFAYPKCSLGIVFTHN